MFGFQKKNPVSPHAKLRIEFHKEARHFGEHGKIRVSHRKQNIDDQIVVFVFPDTVTPPPLDPSLIDYIWDQASAQGYIATSLIEYGRDRESVQFGAREVPLSKDRAEAIAKSMANVLGGEVSKIASALKNAADIVSDFDDDELNTSALTLVSRNPALPVIDDRRVLETA